MFELYVNPTRPSSRLRRAGARRSGRTTPGIGVVHIGRLLWCIGVVHIEIAPSQRPYPTPAAASQPYGLRCAASGSAVLPPAQPDSAGGGKTGALAE
jgi:hypothetical protein